MFHRISSFQLNGEVIEHGKFTVKSDVWSFGIVLWEILEFGKVPYSDMSNPETIKNLQLGYRLPQPHNCPSSVYQLMLKCWDSNPTTRPTFSAIQNIVKKFLLLNFSPIENNNQISDTSYDNAEILYNSNENGTKDYAHYYNSN